MTSTGSPPPGAGPGTSAAILLLSAAAFFSGAALRVFALALVLLALANPSFTREDREPLTSVAAVIIDKSPSQNFGTRNQETAKAQEALIDSLKKIKGLELRVVEAGQADGETDGTRLFGALSSALSDVPVDRVAGAFLITDGRVHDIPANAAGIGFQAPVAGTVKELIRQGKVRFFGLSEAGVPSIGEISDAMERVFTRHRATIRSIAGVYGSAYEGDEDFAAAALRLTEGRGVDYAIDGIGGQTLAAQQLDVQLAEAHAQHFEEEARRLLGAFGRQGGGRRHRRRRGDG